MSRGRPAPTRLSWREIRERAAKFAREWSGAGYERGEAQSFYNDFFDIFGVSRRRVASFEEPVRRLGNRRGYIDLFWKGVLIVEQKSAGGNLIKAKEQALDYFPGLSEEELPRYVLLSDFQTFELHDLEAGGAPVRFMLAGLQDKVEAFAFILGREPRSFADQEPVSIKAAELLGQLHDALERSGYRGHDLERFLVRLVFCLFADHTGIFEPRGIFAELVASVSRQEGLGARLIELFDVLNTEVADRQAGLDPDLAQFPFVNGGLFGERLRVPSFNLAMRHQLEQAMAFDWAAVSPAIFGSLFQSVMDRDVRRRRGAHYTSEANILKVIQPLFLDELHGEFARILTLRSGRQAALEALRERLAGLRLLDPACGCGNFLVIAYRELRRLELNVLRELRSQGQLNVDVNDLSILNVDQFYGIELLEFPARVAEVAMWMTDHLMNRELAREFGEYRPRIPLLRSPHIAHADALDADWAALLPPSECAYILGNPPYGGSKVQSPEQRAQVRRIAGLGGAGGTLDYVAAWFIKAGEYLRQSRAQIGFVATNSITQGEQVAQLWPLLFDRYGLEISFAHRAFPWFSQGRGMAHVHVVIIGLAHADQVPAARRLFSCDAGDGNPTESLHASITAYLFDGGSLASPHLVVREAPRPLGGEPELLSGSQPIYGGNYIFDQESRKELLDREPGAEVFLRPFLGSEEFINGTQRWILYLAEAEPADLRRLPEVRRRVAAVRGLREASKRASTRRLAQAPTLFQVMTVPDVPYLAIPEVSSERREYVPIGWLEPPTIPSNLLRVLPGATHWHCGILTSAMHMAWLRQIGGRLKSDYRYSIGIVYNTFPWPGADAAQMERVAALARDVLEARAKHPNSSLADLYDPDTMPQDLRKAHHALDAAVDRLYRAKGFGSELERVEHLFTLYERLTAPLGFPGGGAAGRGRRPRGR
jgi:hypothetical protein